MSGAGEFPFFDGRKPRIFGHRGAAGVAPENTLVSCKRALEDGADFLELDVRKSADGELVIIHDATLERTTNDRGEVKGRLVGELKGLDAAYWFSLDGGRTHPYRGQQIGIPSVEDFFSVFSAVKAILEIKDADAAAIKKLMAIIRRFDREKQVLLAAEDDGIMGEIRRQAGEEKLSIATGSSYGEVAAFMKGVWEGGGGSFTPPGQALQVPCLYEELTLVSAESVQAAHEVGREIHVWTINEVGEMKRLIDLGVDGIVTDYPVRMKVLDEENITAS